MLSKRDSKFKKNDETKNFFLEEKNNELITTKHKKT